MEMKDFVGKEIQLKGESKRFKTFVIFDYEQVYNSIFIFYIIPKSNPRMARILSVKELLTALENGNAKWVLTKGEKNGIF